MAKGRKTGGRQKGTPNKVTAELRDMILQALADEGGVAYLRRQARKTPGPFLSLLAKLLPTAATIEHKGPSLEELVVQSITPQPPEAMGGNPTAAR